MTVMIPEAVEGTVARRSAAKTAVSRRATGTPPRRTLRAEPVEYRVADAGANAGDQAAQGARQRPSITGNVNVGRPRVPSGSFPGGRNYQGVILAEFLAAVLVVAFMPLFSGPPDGKPGPSPYRVNDITQLAAIGAVYFVLALLSSGERSGKIVAWFGGAVLIGILYKKTVNGQLTAAIAPTPVEDNSGSTGA